MSTPEVIPSPIESTSTTQSLLSTVGNVLLRSAAADSSRKSLTQFFIGAALIVADRAPKVKNAVEASLPEDGDNVDRALLTLHEIGVLHAEERFFRRTPDGVPVFYIHPKFRTMHRDKAAEAERIKARSEGRPVKGDLDGRTEFGRFLEATSLDELPSFINLVRRDRKPSAAPRRFRLTVRGNRRPMLREEIDSPITIEAYRSIGRDHIEVQSSADYQPCAFPITSVGGLRVAETPDEQQLAAKATTVPRSQYPKKVIRSSLHPRYRKQTSYHRAKQNSPAGTEEFDLAV